jgi:hypothetical protein
VKIVTILLAADFAGTAIGQTIVYQATLPAASEDFEYYATAEPAGGQNPVGPQPHRKCIKPLS